MSLYFDKYKIDQLEPVDQLKVIGKLSIFIFLLSIIFCYKCDVSKNELLVGVAWIKKDLYISFVDIGYEHVTFPNEYGFEITLTKRKMMQDEYVLSVIDKLKITFYKSLILTAINIIVVGGFIIFHFERINDIYEKNEVQVELLKQELLTQEEKLQEAEAKSSANFTQTTRKSASYKEFSGSI